MEQKQLWPGWETIRVIGSGGYGKVYEIRKTDTSGEYRAALKTISIPASPDEYDSYKADNYSDESITCLFKSQLDNMVSEFSLMSQFKGVSNIVSYEDHMIVPHDDGIGWDILIRMELLTSLPAYCNLHPMGTADVIKLAKDICRALILCEKKHIIHRDIKPQNIFVNEFGDFKLGDFGIAKTMEHTTKATKTGTYHYMAPEVYKGERYNATVDLYALGLVLYWLLNDRRLPFLPTDRPPTWDESNEAQAKRLRGEEFPMPKHGTELLNSVIQKACAFHPADRYQSAEKMLEALGEHVSTPPSLVLCPWCGGTGIQNILDDDLAHYSKQTCTACQGHGKLSPDNPKLTEHHALLASSGHNGASSECGVCRGLGWLSMKDGRPFSCPFCKNSGTETTDGTNDPWGPTAPPTPPPNDPHAICLKCGSKIPKGETLCKACKDAVPDPDLIVCPHCLGTKIQTFTKSRGFSTAYWDDICGVCHGAGKINNDEYGAALSKSYKELRKTAAASGTISKDCPVCHGLGQVFSLSKFLGIAQIQISCPKCSGGKVKKIDNPPVM